MNIRAVILDFGGTLVHGELEWEPYHENIRSFLSSLGYPLSMRDLKKALRSAIQHLGRVRKKGGELTFNEVYSRFLTNLGIRVETNMLDYLHENYITHYRTEFYPCVDSLLEQLSRKYKVALLSNTISDQPKKLIKKAGLDQYFDVMHCSCELGLRKPNPAIFRRVLTDLGVCPCETVHVGDSVEADMIGALDSKITGVWIKNPDQPIWSGRAINNIRDLPALLTALENEAYTIQHS